MWTIILNEIFVKIYLKMMLFHTRTYEFYLGFPFWETSNSKKSN